MAFMVQLFNMYNARRKSKDDAKSTECVLRREALLELLQTSHELRAAPMEKVWKGVADTKLALLRFVLMSDQATADLASKYYGTLLSQARYTLKGDEATTADMEKAAADVVHAEAELIDMARKNYDQFALPQVKLSAEPAKP